MSYSLEETSLFTNIVFVIPVFDDWNKRIFTRTNSILIAHKYQKVT